MRSMTGYGRGKALLAGHQITVELSSVNRKQSEIALSLPRTLVELEPRIRDEINTRISRGRLTVAVAVHSSSRKTEKSINVKAAKTYYEELVQLRKALKLKDDISIEAVLRGPGVLSEETETLDPDLFWPSVQQALKAALNQLIDMRRKEGAALAKDFARRLKFLEQQTAQIAARAPLVLEKYREALLQRTRNSGLEIQANDERLLKEIVFFSDRSDISEELTRLKSHFVQVKDLLKKDEAIGRTLDFIIQEMNREVNTIGSKGNDLEISQTVVALKTELEKIREQAQNIE